MHCTGAPPMFPNVDTSPSSFALLLLLQEQRESGQAEVKEVVVHVQLEEDWVGGRVCYV